MEPINLLTVRNDDGQIIHINKAHIITITPGDEDEDNGCYLPATITTVHGDKIEVSREEDYNDLISRWTA